MVDRLFIDPEALTAKGTVLTGVLRPAELEDLAAGLANGDGELRYRVTAGLDRLRRRVVSCTISGFVFLTCQRSFDTFRHEVDIDDRLVLVATEAELPPLEAESDGEDFVLAASPIDVRRMIEEAVILALPMVPCKPGIEQAAEPGRWQEPARPGKFAALAGFRRAKDKS